MMVPLLRATKMEVHTIQPDGTLIFINKVGVTWDNPARWAD
jgi:hypothetical protein